MQINNELIASLEDISCLVLSDDEKSRMKGEFQEILNNLMPFHEINTQDVPECIHGGYNRNIFREDQVFPSLERQLILKNAPVKNNETFIAPKTVE